MQNNNQFRATVSFHNRNPNTVYNKLKEKLGREPSHAELKAEVSRILSGS